jgi:hypothetical protein
MIRSSIEQEDDVRTSGSSQFTPAMRQFSAPKVTKETFEYVANIHLIQVDSYYLCREDVSPVAEKPKSAGAGSFSRGSNNRYITCPDYYTLSPFI